MSIVSKIGVLLTLRNAKWDLCLEGTRHILERRILWIYYSNQNPLNMDLKGGISVAELPTNGVPDYSCRP